VRGECDQTERCTIREPLRKVNQSIEDVLKKIKIADMTEASDTTGHESKKTLAELITLS
jgi:DNA-binding IscR family transcriptional regulator